MGLGRNRRRGRWAAIVALATVGAGWQTAVAFGASHDAMPSAVSGDDGTPRHCVVVLGRPGGSATAPSELYRYCTPTSRADAQANLQTLDVTKTLGRTLASKDLLMTWFTDADYGGSSTDVYGYYGTCDPEGYRLEPDEWWRTRISSAAGGGKCTRATFIGNHDKSYSEPYVLPVPNLGTKLNDNVSAIQVKSAG